MKSVKCIESAIRALYPNNPTLQSALNAACSDVLSLHHDGSLNSFRNVRHSRIFCQSRRKIVFEWLLERCLKTNSEEDFKTLYTAIESAYIDMADSDLSEQKDITYEQVINRVIETASSTESLLPYPSESHRCHYSYPDGQSRQDTLRQSLDTGEITQSEAMSTSSLGDRCYTWSLYGFGNLLVTKGGDKYVYAHTHFVIDHHHDGPSWKNTTLGVSRFVPNIAKNIFYPYVSRDHDKEENTHLLPIPNEQTLVSGHTLWRVQEKEPYNIPNPRNPSIELLVVPREYTFVHHTKPQ